MTLPSLLDFRNFQIEHYSKRFAEAKTPEEKSFLRKTLFALKKQQNEAKVLDMPLHCNAIIKRKQIHHLN